MRRRRCLHVGLRAAQIPQSAPAVVSAGPRPEVESAGLTAWCRCEFPPADPPEMKLRLSPSWPGMSRLVQAISRGTLSPRMAGTRPPMTREAEHHVPPPVFRPKGHRLRKLDRGPCGRDDHV